MKRMILTLILVSAGTFAFSQLRQGNRPTVLLDPSEGFITVNELVAGFGLGDTATPYSKYFFGVTSVNGLQVNENFMVGGGTGLLFFNDGLIIPLFAEIRVRFAVNSITPFITGSGGLLLNPSDFNSGTLMFISPNAGARFTLNRNFAISTSAGLWMQMGSGISRASFVNLKVGAVYKF